MPAITLLQLRDRVKERARQTYSSLVDQVELDYLINLGIKRLHSHCVRSHEYLFDTFTTITCDGTGSYPLPEMHSMLSVECLTNTVNPILVRRLTPQDVGLYTQETTLSQPAGYHVRRSLFSDWEIVILPTGFTGQIRVRYLPPAPTLSTATDTIQSPNGWEEYAILDAAIACMRKERSDPSALMAAQALVLQDILAELNVADALQDPRAREQKFDPTTEGPRMNIYGHIVG